MAALKAFRSSKAAMRILSGRPLSYLRHPHPSTQPESPESSIDDEWSNWEFGSFTTRTRKTSEQANADRSAQNMKNKGNKSQNIDNEWSYLSDEQVEVGILALKASSTEGRVSKLETVLDDRTSNVRFIFEDPHNPNNLWAALRTADSFGIQFVDIIVNEGHSPAVMQKSMVQALGSQKWLSLTQHSSTTSCLEMLKSQGYHVIASDLSASSKPIGSIKWRDSKSVTSTLNSPCRAQEAAVTADTSASSGGLKIAVVMGNEKSGISDDMRSQADELFYLPMKGFAESFNLAAASAITCAYLDSMQVLTPSLAPSLKRRILLTWLARSVDGSMPLLRKAGLEVGGKRKPPYAVVCGVSARP